MEQAEIDRLKNIAFELASKAKKFSFEVREFFTNGILNPSPLEVTLLTCHLRQVAWLESLLKLDNSVHFQALSTCLRSQFESLLDIVLLSKEPNAFGKMIAWENSAKINSTLLALKEFKKLKMRVPPSFKERKAFFAANLRYVKSQRVTYFGGTKHPDRWTNRNVYDDSIKVDGIFTSMNKKEEYEKILTQMPLSLFYRVHFPMINANVHSSGLTTIRNMPSEGFDLQSIITFFLSIGLFDLSTKYLADHFQFSLTSHFEERFNNYAVEKVKLFQV